MLHQTALHATHEALGATLVDFGGWDMPLWYPTGAVKEHLAVIQHAGLFDIGHMAGLMVSGPTRWKRFSGPLPRICPCPVRVPLTARSSMRPAAWWMTPSYTP